MRPRLLPRASLELATKQTKDMLRAVQRQDLNGASVHTAMYLNMSAPLATD